MLEKESGKSVLDREDNMSKGTKMVNLGNTRGTVKALNSRAEIEEEGGWIGLGH